jgi:hypothetical protein
MCLFCREEIEYVSEFKEKEELIKITDRKSLMRYVLTEGLEF